MDQVNADKNIGDTSADLKTEQGWQPIETAPKNISVLIFIPNAEHYGSGIYRAILVHFRPEMYEAYWTTTAVNSGYDLGDRHKPTHWMPLPDPPEVKHGNRNETQGHQG